VKHIDVKAARRQWPDLIDEAEAGGEIMITRQGRPVARLGPIMPIRRALPSLKALRDASARRGTPSATLVRREREAR
jgi:prevent-host-death family protein